VRGVWSIGHDKLKWRLGRGKAWLGDHLPGEKVVEDISRTRWIPKGTDALSPALFILIQIPHDGFVTRES
jgi:glutamate synthase domain-containing protein 2